MIASGFSNHLLSSSLCLHPTLTSGAKTEIVALILKLEVHGPMPDLLGPQSPKPTQQIEGLARCVLHRKTIGIPPEKHLGLGTQYRGNARPMTVSAVRQNQFARLKLKPPQFLAAVIVGEFVVITR